LVVSVRSSGVDLQRCGIGLCLWLTVSGVAVTARAESGRDQLMVATADGGFLFGERPVAAAYLEVGALVLTDGHGPMVHLRGQTPLGCEDHGEGLDHWLLSAGWAVETAVLEDGRGVGAAAGAGVVAGMATDPLAASSCGGGAAFGHADVGSFVQGLVELILGPAVIAIGVRAEGRFALGPRRPGGWAEYGVGMFARLGVRL
jgi:hypothetical protein